MGSTMVSDMPGAFSATMMSDEGFVNGIALRAAGGDLDAMRVLLDDVTPAMKRVILGAMGADHPDIEDALQQARLALVQGLGAFRAECHVAGYASRIALRVALRARRSSRVRQARCDKLREFAQGEIESRAPTSEVPAERRRRVVRELLAQLPEEQAETFGLRVILGWSLEEVAKSTGVPVNTVRSRVRLAKEALRRRIEANPDLAEELG